MINQYKNQRYNWKKFREDVLDGKKPIISSLALDDLRRFCFMLEFPQAGNYKSSNYAWDVSVIPFNPVSADLEKPVRGKGYIGDWNVALFDTSHGMYELGDKEAKTAGRYIRFVNKRIITYSMCCCIDTASGRSAEWKTGETYQIGDCKFYLPNGNVYIATAINTNQPPIKADGTLNSDYWSLKFSGPPCLYQYDNNGTIEYRSKIHYDTWLKGHTYAKYNRVSWSGGWELKDVLPDAVKNIPPHLWAGEKTNVTTYSDTHPAGTTWSGGQYPKGKLVLDNNSPNIKAYRAIKKVQNTTEDLTIESTHPENLPEYWERAPELDVYWTKLSSEWNFEDQQQNWIITPDYGNFIHDYDLNSPGKILHYDLQIDAESEEIFVEDYIDCHQSRFFPCQVDPQEKYEKIIFAYKDLNFNNLTGTASFRGQRDILWNKSRREKFRFNATQITDPSTLGPVFYVNRWSSYFHEGVNEWVYFKTVPVLEAFKKWWDGNPYANAGDMFFNAPFDIGNWSTNPKIGTAYDGCTSLENMVEVLLSQSHWRLPASYTFKQNWIKTNYGPTSENPSPSDGNMAYETDSGGSVSVVKYKTGTGWVGVSLDEIEAWDPYPSVCDENWGTNGCGIETFLSQLIEKRIVDGNEVWIDKWDWVFIQNSNLQYIPDSVLYHAERTQNGQGSNGQTPWPPAELCLDAWNCYTDAAGNFRRTFRYSLGRRSPFIRPNEMGNPGHLKDTWTPGTCTYEGHTFTIPISYLSRPNHLWLGARTNATPKISDFCENFETITPLAVQGIAWVQDQPFKKGTVVNYSNISYYAKQDITNLTDNPSINNQYEKIYIHTFTISGNRATNTTEEENLKPGWMIHLFNYSGSYPDISENPDNMKSIHIVDVRYDEAHSKTYITVDTEICVGTTNNGTYFNKMAWDRNVSLRHDYSAVNYIRNEDGGIDAEFYYNLNPELLLDLYDLLHLVIYKTISSTRNLFFVESVFGAATGTQPVSYMTLKNYAIQWLRSQLDFSDAAITAGYTKYPDPEKYPYALGSVHTGGGNGLFQCYCNPYMSIFSEIHVHTTTEYLAYKASAVALGWAESYKNLPKTILAKIYLNEMWGAGNIDPETGGRTGYYWNMPQSTQVGSLALSNFIIPWSAETEATYQLKTHYAYVALSADGRRYWAKPENFFPYIYLDGTEDPTINCWADMNMGLTASDTYIIIINLDDEIAQEFYTPNFYHVDAPRIFVEDTKCPEPNPPIHYIDPTAYLKYILPYDLLPDEDEDGEPDDITEWIYDHDYAADEKVFVWINDYRQVFTAKNAIVNKTISPINNPTEWTWELPYVELRLEAESCLCQDKESSDPVSYQLICLQDKNLSRPYTPDRKADMLLKTVDLVIDDVSLPDTSIISQLDYESFQQNVSYPRDQLVEQYGYMYRVIVDNTTDLTTAPYLNTTEYKWCKTLIPTDNSANYSIGDIIEILGTKSYDRIAEVTDIGTGWIEFNLEDTQGTYLNATDKLPTGSYIINRTKTYNHDKWITDPQPSPDSFAEYEFAWQARDNAANIQGMAADNETLVSEYTTCKEPEDYIDYFDE
jgi:hypothetical protein